MPAPELPSGFGTVTGSVRLHGGSIAEVHRCDLTDGRRVVVKRTSYDADLEAEGLRALADAGAPVPGVLHVEPTLLVLEHVEGPPDWARLGQALAGVHDRAGEDFGWHRDNVIGPLTQPNEGATDWPTFYADRRLAPYLGELPPSVGNRIRGAIDDGRLADLLEHGAPPSLVHGDLWSGNVVGGRWLVDPAVHHADRELDLAMADLFGGFPAAFWSAYTEAWPLDPGWERRRHALQLYHLLVHVRLFGQTYTAQVRGRLDALGW